MQTDNPGYWRNIESIVPIFFEWHSQPRTWPDAPKGRTRREIIALRRGLPVFRGYGLAKPGLSETEAVRLAESLPLPVFDADWKLQELDRLEKSSQG